MSITFSDGRDMHILLAAVRAVRAGIRAAGRRRLGILATSWRGVPPAIHLHRADVSCEHSLREHAYLFLAFNTSTAFSPTDTAILSRRAKVLIMVQALLSLLNLAVLVSRAVNTFGMA